MYQVFDILTISYMRSPLLCQISLHKYFSNTCKVIAQICLSPEIKLYFILLVLSVHLMNGNKHISHFHSFLLHECTYFC